MTTITIPQFSGRKERLVAVPSGLYKKFLLWQKQFKSVRTYKPTASEKQSLRQACLDYKKGDYYTLNELKQKLGFTRS